MKITAISQQKKNPDRYSIYIDDQFVFGFSQGDLLKSGIKIGQEVTTEELERYRDESELGKAYDKAISYLNIRSRSKQEIADYLKRKKYSTEIANQIITKLENLNLINDLEFARLWVQWRQSKLSSKLKLKQELIQKGVDSEIIERVLEDIDEDQEVEQVKKLIEKYGYRYDSKQKLMAYLSRKGYNYSVIQTALDDSEAIDS
ncbi:MAG: RecX family transcriptional regulator [Candidatus Saccharimonadales bacterium]